MKSTQLNFETFKPNMETMEDYLKNNSSNDSTGPNWWSIPQGQSVIRILPPWDASGRVALPVYSHRIEFQGEGMRYKKYTWTCVNKTFNKPCKICEGLQRLAQAGINVEEYEPNSRQFYFNALVMYDPVYEADVRAGKRESEIGGVAPGTLVLMKSPKVLFDWVISQITNPMIGDITSIDNGIDVFITKEGSGLGTKYTPTLSPNGRARVPQEYLDKIESLYNLDDIFSTGFEDEQVNQLIAHLEQSSNFVGQGVPNVVQTAAGYQQSPYYGSQTLPQQPQVVPQTPQYASVQPTYTQPTPVAQTPQYAPQQSSTSFAQTPVVNPFNPVQGVQQTIPTAPVASSPVPPVTPAPVQPVPPVTAETTGERPTCFGQYNPASVNCVVCSHELECSQNSK